MKSHVLFPHSIAADVHGYGLELHVLIAEIHEPAEGIAVAPGILGNEEATALPVMGQSTELHAMIVSGAERLKGTLPVELVIVRLVVLQYGDTTLKVKTGLADVALPTDRMAMLERMDDGMHERVDRHVEEMVTHLIVRDLQDKRLAKRMMGEARQREIFLGTAHAMGKLQRRVAGSQHHDGTGQITDLLVKCFVHAPVHLPERSACPCNLLYRAGHDRIVDGLLIVIAVVGQHAIHRHEIKDHRRHATHRHLTVVAVEIEMRRLVFQHHPGQIVNRQVHRVALHEMLRLDGSQHGIDPAQRAVALVENGCGLDDHVITELTPHRLASQRAPAADDHHKTQEAKKYFLHCKCKDKQLFDYLCTMNAKIEDFEIMAPVGSRESLAAALQAGADSVYFGIGQLNMRSHSANHFDISDLQDIARICNEHGVKTYLTVNTIIYDEDMDTMHTIIDAAHEAGISAVIASDVAVMVYCHQVGMEVHLSTQLNISNVEALKFYAQFADVSVLARELNMKQVSHIHDEIERQQICGPAGKPVRIEMFCHGALCMAVSGKCYMSLAAADRSANRGQCVQICRRSYIVTDAETGNQLEIDNKYVMSPKDLKTIRFLDKMMKAGVRVFKIEGRARGPEYVYTVVTCYKDALKAVLDGTFTEEKKDAWDQRLTTVFNRGFWDGYYQGQTMGEWNKHYGSLATERKRLVGKVAKYFSKLNVAEIAVEAAPFEVGDKLLITGNTTGAMYLDCTEIRYDLKPVERAEQGWLVSIPVKGKVRLNDKFFKLEKVEYEDD